MTKDERPLSARRSLAYRIAKCGGFLEGTLFRSDRPAIPPIFILGLPRSGSTLFYHSVCQTFETAHTVRLGRYLWFAPSVSAWLIRLLCKKYSPDYRSDYGIGNSLASPLTTNLWNLWFDRDAFVDEQNLIESRAEQAVRMAGRVERVFDRPFVDKNQRFNQWVRALAELFDDAVFVVTLRAPLGVSLSLLRARLDLYGDFQTWVHKRPRSFPELDNLTPEREVVHQVHGIAQDLCDDMEHIGPHRFAVVEYEAFCNDPRSCLIEFEEFFREHGVTLTQRGDVPQKFDAVASRTDSLTPEQVDAVTAAVNELFPSGQWQQLPCRKLTPVHNRDDVTATKNDSMPGI